MKGGSYEQLRVVRDSYISRHTSGLHYGAAQVYSQRQLSDATAELSHAAQMREGGMNKYKRQWRQPLPFIFVIVDTMSNTVPSQNFARTVP